MTFQCCVVVCFALRSGSAHSRLRSGSAHCDPALAGGEGAEEEKSLLLRRDLIKPNNPHLAGGEQHVYTSTVYIYINLYCLLLANFPFRVASRKCKSMGYILNMEPSPFSSLSRAVRGFSTFDFKKPMVRTWFLGFCLL